MTSKSLIWITRHITRNAFMTEEIPAVKEISMYPDEEAICDAVYYPYTQSIEVFHLQREPHEVMWSLLHELAHHICLCRNGASAVYAHNAAFFMTFRLLLTQAVQFGYMTKEQLEDGSNAEKYRELQTNSGPILTGRNPQKMEELNKKKWVFVRVGNNSEIADILQNTGYEYSESDRLWQKLVPVKAIRNERIFLSQFKGIEKIFECPLSEIYYDPLFSIILLIEDNDTYPYRDRLKQASFRYDKENRMWFKNKVPRSELDNAKNELYDINPEFIFNITGITRKMQEGVAYDF